MKGDYIYEEECEKAYGRSLVLCSRRWDGYGVFTSWDRAREECDGYSDNKKKKFKTFEEAKAYAEDEYRKLHGVESSCYVEEIGWLDYFYRRMMKREVAEQMGIRIRPFTL